MGDADLVQQARAGAARFSPAVRFGVRAAVLAGLVITAGTAAGEFAGAFDDPETLSGIWPTSTTCCPDEVR